MWIHRVQRASTGVDKTKLAHVWVTVGLAKRRVNPRLVLAVFENASFALGRGCDLCGRLLKAHMGAPTRGIHGAPTLPKAWAPWWAKWMGEPLCVTSRGATLCETVCESLIVRPVDVCVN